MNELLIQYPGVASTVSSIQLEFLGVASTVQTTQLDFLGVEVDKADEGSFILVFG